MSKTTFYVIKVPGGAYLAGTPKQWNNWNNIHRARKFKSIAEIRSFMTRMLKYPSKISVHEWKIERHDIASDYPLMDIFTMSHTMALLKRQNSD